MPRIRPPKSRAENSPETKPNHSLDEIAVQVRAILRGHVKDYVKIGKLVQRAFDECEFGDYKEWLEREFDMSEDTAMNYRNLYKLSENPNGSGFVKLNITASALYRLAAHFLKSDDKAQEEITRQVKRAVERAEKSRVTLHTVRYIINPPHCLECNRGEEEVEAAGYVMIKPTCSAFPFCTECVERLEAETCSVCGKSGKDVGVFREGTEGFWRIDGEIFCNDCKEKKKHLEEKADADGVEDDELSPEELARRARLGEQHILAMQQAWLAEHPGDPLPEHLCELDNPEPGREAWCEEAGRFVDGWLARALPPSHGAVEPEEKPSPKAKLLSKDEKILQDFCREFEAFEMMSDDVDQLWLQAINRVGQERFRRLVSKLKSALDDNCGTASPVKSAADRAEAKTRQVH